MKHWSFLFSYLVAPEGAVCLFVCFSSKAMEFFFICLFICCAVFFWHANGSDFLSRRAHSVCFPQPIRRPFSRAQATQWHFLPRSAHLVFGRDFMLSIFLLQSRTNFSSMPNFWLAAELLELSDTNLTTCNLKLAEYFIRFTFDNILLHVTQAKKTNREVRHLALTSFIFSTWAYLYLTRGSKISYSNVWGNMFAFFRIEFLFSQRQRKHITLYIWSEMF